MKIRHKFFKHKSVKISLISIGAVLVLALLSFAIYSLAHTHKVYRGQYLGGVKLGGLTESQLEKKVQDLADSFDKTAITLVNSDNNKTYTINPAEINLNYDTEAITSDIWSVGRNKNAFIAFWEQIKTIFTKNTHMAVVSYDTATLGTKIGAIATELDRPEKDYAIYYSDEQFKLNTDRQSGQRIDQVTIKKTIKSQIDIFESAKISFALKKYQPQVSKKNAERALTDANKILAAGDLTLKSGTADFTADKDTVGGFIVSKVNRDDLNLVLNTERVQAFISQLATSIDVIPRDAKLTMSSDKVSVFQLSQTGKTLDQAKTLEDIRAALFARISDSTSVDPVTITLTIATQQPDVTSDNISKYGINEVVGTGTTSFYNSPSNRVHNITIGAAAINGVLLKPGEEFSTLGHLGKIDASTGYLPELVIKNDKTVPDFGGGLCQVSTTLFRAAMNAGMKITERRNHAYRVSYYEPPAGMDATIFDPSPDFKFVNNYGSYILIQSQIVGTKITFTFYGTKDGRSVSISDPLTTNYVEPPAPVETVSDTLQPGEKKLVGHSHQGATTDFQYTVKAADGTVLQNKNFHSVYTAIAEEWLVGPPLPADTPAPTDGTAPAA